MNIRLLESAKDDLRSGWSFYERQSPGLGNTFLAAIDSDVQTLALYAGTHLKLDGFLSDVDQAVPVRALLLDQRIIDRYLRHP